MAGAVAHAEWDAEGFATALRLDDAEKAELLKAWETYKKDKDPENLTPAAILRELLGEMNDRYVHAHDDKTCVLGQCNCGAALQLPPQDRQRGVKIVYSWSKAEAGVPPTDIGHEAHEYGKDFTIEAVFVDIAYLKQVISGNGPCEISARKGRIPKKFKDVTLVDMLAASAMQKLEANEATKWFRVGDGVGLLTAPPARIPRAWRHSETTPVELFAGIQGGKALWPYNRDECHPCRAQERVMAAVDSVDSAETSPQEDRDLLADEAVMEHTYDLRIVKATGEYCTFKFTKTREDVSFLLQEIGDNDEELDRYGSLHKVKDHNLKNLKQSLDRAQTASRVLKALEYIHKSLNTTDSVRAHARKYYALRKHMQKLLPEHDKAGGKIDGIDSVSEGIMKYDEYLTITDKSEPAVLLCETIPDKMKEVILLVRNVCTASVYDDNRTDITPSDFLSNMEKKHEDLEGHNSLEIEHFAYYQELLRMIKLQYPNQELLSVKIMQETCKEYATILYTIKVIDELEKIYIQTEMENEFQKKMSICRQNLSEPTVRNTTLDAVLKAPAPAHTLYLAETITGRYWVTLHDIEPAEGVPAEAAAEAALCWAEWFRAYVNRDGNAKQKCVGVMVRIAAPVPISEDGVAGTCVRTLLGAQQMRYTPCARPMLRHGGGADATHTWYAKDKMSDDFEVEEKHSDQMDTRYIENVREIFSTLTETTNVPQTQDRLNQGDGEPKPDNKTKPTDPGETQAHDDNLKKNMVCLRPARSVHARCMRAPSCRYHTLPTWYSRPVPRHHTHLLQQVICGSMLTEMLKDMEQIPKNESSKIKWTRYYSVQEKKQVEDGDACLQTLASTLWAEELYHRVQTQKSYFKKNANIICKEMLNEKKRLAIDFYNVSTHS